MPNRTTIQKIQELFNSKSYIEIIVAATLFVVAIATNSVISIIIHMLYFIILLELVRAVLNFIREKRIRISILIDAFIILTLREFIVNVVKLNGEKIDTFQALFTNDTHFHIIVFSGVLVFLFVLRWLAYKTSPDQKDSNEISV